MDGFDTTKTRKHLIEKTRADDGHWGELMRLAEKYGFILEAVGGTAILATNKSQLEAYTIPKYTEIQHKNGRCPKTLGLPCCYHVNAITEPYCHHNCELYKQEATL